MKIILALLIFFQSPLAFSETITLKNGTTLKGTINLMTESEVILDTSNLGKISIKRYTIESIEQDAKASPPQSTDQEKTSTSSPQEPQADHPKISTLSLTPAVISSPTQNSGSKSKVFFGVDVVSKFYDWQFGNTVKTFDFTLLGYRAENGVQISLNADLSTDLIGIGSDNSYSITSTGWDVNESGQQVNPYDYSGEYNIVHELKSLSLKLSAPIVSWSMLGSNNKLRFEVAAGVMEYHITDAEFQDYYYNPVLSESNGQVAIVEGTTEYSLQLFSALELNFAATVGTTIKEMAFSTKELTDNSDNDNPKEPPFINTWTSLSAGLRILI